jgi:rubrerythrin
MRLIDADALIDKTDDRYSLHEIGRRERDDIVDALEYAPTIQPKRGKWIHHPEIGWGETWLCDQCGEKTTSTVMGKPRANFCPMCGAKMEVTT